MIDQTSTLDLSLWAGPKVDLKALSRDELVTVMHVASIIGRAMTDDEVQDVRFDSENALTIIDAGTIGERLDALVREQTSWPELTRDRQDAGLAFSFALTRESTVPMFASLHGNLSASRARKMAAAVV